MNIPNYNRNSADTQKNARRHEWCDAAVRANLTPENVLLFPGVMGHDAKIVLERFPTADILGLERSGGAYHQRDRNVFDQASPLMICTTFKRFLNGEVARIEVEKTDPKFHTIYSVKVPVDDKEMARIHGLRFNFAYLDYIQKCTEDVFAEVRTFLKTKTADRYIVAVTNTKANLADDRFARFGDIAKEVGAQFTRNDYRDSSPMGFGIFARL